MVGPLSMLVDCAREYLELLLSLCIFGVLAFCGRLSFVFR